MTVGLPKLSAGPPDGAGAGGRCLGDRVTPLVDGELASDAAQRAQAHAAHCRSCAAAMHAEALTKRRLVAMATPEPTEELLGRLIALGGPSGPLPPRELRIPTAVPARPAGRAARAVRAPSRPDGRRPVGRRSGRRLLVAGAVVGACSMLALGVSGLASVGASSGSVAAHFTVPMTGVTISWPVIGRQPADRPGADRTTGRGK